MPCHVTEAFPTKCTTEIQGGVCFSYKLSFYNFGFATEVVSQRLFEAAMNECVHHHVYHVRNCVKCVCIPHTTSDSVQGMRDADLYDNPS
jgi:hypothetical protein